MCSFLKITELFWQRSGINFDKNGTVYFLGDFFTNSSGHPDREAQRQHCKT
jgi:hypothetical protein